jgi:choline dehydrogenase-like flavoprotein
VKILIVGSGPSGVHFALTVLRKNHRVVMLDVGRPSPEIPLPDADFLGLKSRLQDPARYFLGPSFRSASLPGQNDEYYGLPPSKDYVFDRPAEFSFVQDGLEPLVSFAAGGLAESWTGGCYPLNDHELREFPFDYQEIAPYYSEIAARIGVAGGEDDLSSYFPGHDHLLPMLDLDESGARLLAAYERHRSRLSTRYKARLGRSRQAVLSRPIGERRACTYCGRCLWGCPQGAFYTPSLTLRECLSYANFQYVPNAFASHFELAPSGSIERLLSYDLDKGAQIQYAADAYVLACGTLSTSNLVLRTIYKSRREIVRLTGLMDNRQLLAPLCNLSMLGHPHDANSYQYHQLAFGIETDAPDRYVHGQITTLKTATTHPIFSKLPIDLRSAIGVFRHLRSSLTVLNLNFCDWRREGNYITLSDELRDARGWPTLTIKYRPTAEEPELLRKAHAVTRGFFRELGAPLIPGMTHIRPMGASVHYSGTLPMSTQKRQFSVSPECRFHDIDNLFVVDGSVMPFLPAKNLTFTLMANAARVASKAF